MRTLFKGRSNSTRQREKWTYKKRSRNSAYRTDNLRIKVALARNEGRIINKISRLKVGEETKKREQKNIGYDND